MELFSSIVPIFLAVMPPIMFLTLPVAFVLFLISVFSKDQEKKHTYKKVSEYLLWPFFIVLTGVVLWGVVGLIKNLS